MINEDCKGALSDPFQYRHPRSRVKQRAEACFNSKFPIQAFIWIGDHVEWKLASVAFQVPLRRVEDDDFSYRGSGDFRPPLHERMQMQVADGTASETPELQMHQPFMIWHSDGLGADVQQFPRLHNFARMNPIESHPAILKWLNNLFGSRYSVHLANLTQRLELAIRTAGARLFNI